MWQKLKYCNVDDSSETSKQNFLIEKRRNIDVRQEQVYVYTDDEGND